MRRFYQQVPYELNAIARCSWDAIPDAVVISPEQLQAVRITDDDRTLFTARREAFHAPFHPRQT